VPPVWRHFLSCNKRFHSRIQGIEKRLVARLLECFLNLTAYQNVAHKAGQISAYQFLKNGQQIGTGSNIAERIFLALPIRSERLV
jgi:hypothetical protein